MVSNQILDCRHANCRNEISYCNTFFASQRSQYGIRDEVFVSWMFDSLWNAIKHFSRQILSDCFNTLFLNRSSVFLLIENTKNPFEFPLFHRPFLFSVCIHSIIELSLSPWPQCFRIADRIYTFTVAISMRFLARIFRWLADTMLPTCSSMYFFWYSTMNLLQCIIVAPL